MKPQRMYNPRKNKNTKRVGAELTLKEFNDLQIVLKRKKVTFSDWLRDSIAQGVCKDVWSKNKICGWDLEREVAGRLEGVEFGREKVCKDC